MIKLLAQRNFRLLWIGQFVSVTGSWLLFVALPFYIYNLTNSAIATTIMFAIETLPSILFGPLAGVLVDRWDRRITLIISDLLRTVILLPALLVQSADSVWILYLMYFLVASIGTFFAPAKQAIIPNIVSKDELVPANSLNSLSDSIAMLIGPSIGGALLGWWGFGSLIILDSLSYLVSALMLVLLVVPAKIVQPLPPADTRSRMWTELIEGIQLMRRDRYLLGVLITTATFMLAGGISNSVNVIFLRDAVHADVQQWGWLISTQGAGAIIGGLILSKLNSWVSVTRIIAVSAALAGILVAIWFISSSY